MSVLAVIGRVFLGGRVRYGVWLGGWVVRGPDLRSTGRRFESQLPRYASITEQRNLVLVNKLWCSVAAELTADLSESTAAYCWGVYGFGHLRADCRGPGSAPEPYTRFEHVTTFGDGDESLQGWVGIAKEVVSPCGILLCSDNVPFCSTMLGRPSTTAVMSASLTHHQHAALQQHEDLTADLDSYEVFLLVCSVYLPLHQIHCYTQDACTLTSCTLCRIKSSLGSVEHLRLALCGLRGCKNGPAPFPGRMSYKATKTRSSFCFIS